ncbi:hypothetical protein [Melghirimyces algeriensis]|uniref:Uncharacterized protein n=1 Tax=Melghirimyces algeriensis TaxID=910412 RepID=A0A521B8G7_9BACL|nr:hypothetical protein [Melghirimyces algeriensis]SMO43376.1 hypothetical protein SAMN06264849_101609 [Melghirimyces algeriensis]
MNVSIKKNWTSTLLVTVIAFNMMMIGLIIAQHQIALKETAPVTTSPTSASPNQRIDTRTEFRGSRRVGNWEVEHYQKVEVIRDKQGHEIKTRPTGEDTYIRYWKGDQPDS